MRPLGRLPNFIVIGAMKAGTTGLHHYLGLHPQISMSKEKELDFFVQELNWRKGLQWYQSNFSGEAQVRGESSHNYTCYPHFSGVPERMYALVPQAKLIYLLRDPVERIISQYLQNYTDGRENGEMASAVMEASHSRYISRSKYCMQLEQYWRYYSESQILLLTQEALQAQPRETLRNVFRFLEVDETFYDPAFSVPRHESRYLRRKNGVGLFLARLARGSAIRRLPLGVREHVGRWLYRPFSSKVERPVLNQDLRERIITCLADDMRRLRAHTGCAFEDWCV